MKRSDFQNKRLAVSQMASRARKVFGTFEKRVSEREGIPESPDSLESLLSPGVMYNSISQVLVFFPHQSHFETRTELEVT